MTMLFLEEAHDLPVATLQLVFSPGSVADPQGREGLTQMTAEMLRRGAAGRSLEAIDHAIDCLGADVSVAAGPDAVSLTARGLKRNFAALVDLTADIIGRPDFSEAEVEKLRAELLATLDELRDDDHALCARHFSEHLYQDHPYGRPAVGTTRSLAAIAREELREFYRAHFSRQALMLGFSGDLEQSTTGDIAQRLTDKLGSAPSCVSSLPDPPIPGGRSVQIVDKPERTQVQILLGHPAPRWGGVDYDALMVALTAFGGVFSGRLMQEVRVKRGLSYGTSAAVHGGRGPAHVEISVFPAAKDAVTTLELVLDLYEDLVSKGLSRQEVAFARDYLVGHFPLSIETPESRLGNRIDLAVCQLSADFLDRYPERVRAVTAEAACDALTRYATPQKLAITMVATASELAPKLSKAQKRLGLAKISIVPYDKI